MYNNKNIRLLSHLLVWLVLFSMPYLLSYGQEQDISRVADRFWIPLLFSVIIFYVNFFVLIDRFLFKNNLILFLVVNGLLIVVFLLLNEYVTGSLFQDLNSVSSTDSERKGPRLIMKFYVQLLSYLAPLLFSIAIKSTQRWVRTEAERKEAANVKLRSELQHLHYQLQPHFFFNSLNNIYAMVDISPDQAKTSIHSLSKLMRYMLYETNDEVVPLSKEIDFMKKYIDLMKLRITDKTTVSYDFPKEVLGINIAPLLFISLIENAFKHGVSASKESQIEINMKCNDKKILFTIENDNYPKRTDDKSGSGIGLKNLEKRLQLLYPNKYRFENEIKDNRFLVTLEIDTN